MVGLDYRGWRPPLLRRSARKKGHPKVALASA
jgi:hypothetical protein